MPTNFNTTIHYRLKMIDLDGRSRYSTIVAMRADCNKKVNDVVIYPNPASDVLWIQMNLDKGQYQLMITNLLGQNLQTNPLLVQETGQIFTLRDLKRYGKGQYVVTVINRTNGEKHAVKFHIQ